MDPFAIALGVFAVVQTAAQAAETLYDFAKTIHDAPEEIQSLVREARSLHVVLTNINTALKEPKVAAYISKKPDVEKNLASLEEPLKQCEERIVEFIMKLEKVTDRCVDGMRTIKRIGWVFAKKDVNATRDELARTRESATFAFSGFSYVENLKRSAESRELQSPPEKGNLSLDDQLSELQNQGSTLRRAARDGDTRAIALLLDAGAPVDSKNVEARTALSFAAEYGNMDATRLLLERQAFVNAASNEIKEGNYYKRSESKRTPLHWAAVGGHILVAGILLDWGANIEAVTNSQRTPVQEAATANRFKTVGFLLGRGANVNARTYFGWGLLHTATSSGKLDLAELLLSRGADVEAAYTGTWQGEGKSDIGATHQHPLHYAIRPTRRPNPDETAMIELLVEKGGAKILAQDNMGATPMHYAVRSQWTAAVRVLLKHASVADIAIKDAFGRYCT